MVCWAFFFFCLSIKGVAVSSPYPGSEVNRPLLIGLKVADTDGEMAMRIILFRGPKKGPLKWIWPFRDCFQGASIQFPKE